MADSAVEVRNAVIAHLRAHHPDMCRHWFDEIEAVDFDQGTLRLMAAGRVRQTYLKRSCLDLFNEAAQAATGRLVAVVFVSEEEARQREAGRAARQSGPRTWTDAGHGLEDMIISPDYTFSHFVQGPGNRLALAAAQAVAERPGEAYNPLFIYGGVGLGKTHLLQAICQTIMDRHPDKNVYYVSCDSFSNQFLNAVQDGQMVEFRDRFRNVDVLMIDDIHFLTKRDRSQEEFFHTFNTLHQSGRQIVLSSDAAPAEIPDLKDRLVSRFNSGLVTGIEKPCFETRLAILKMKAVLRGLELPDEVASFIASNIDRNIRELEGAIVKLRMLSSMSGRPIDLTLAHDVLGDREPAGKDHQPSVQQIIEVVCDYYDVKMPDLLSRRKFKSIAQPRQVGMWLARKLTRYSLEEIGGYFGGRDHTTVLHAIRTIERRRDEEDRVAKDVEHLRSRLGKPAH